MSTFSISAIQLIAALHLSDTIESKSELKDLLKKCAS